MKYTSHAKSAIEFRGEVVADLDRRASALNRMAEYTNKAKERIAYQAKRDMCNAMAEFYRQITFA